MQENVQDPPIDILEDAPADPVELSPKAEDNPSQAPSEKIEQGETISKKYTNEDLYTMICLALRYPSGGHGGESFWNLMVKIYGSTLLEGRNGGGLRSRWRKLVKDHPSGIEEYKKQLAAELLPEFIEGIENKIAAATAEPDKLSLNAKAYSILFPDAPKPIDTSEKKVYKKKKLEEGVEIIFPEEKKKVKKVKIGIDLNKLIQKGNVIPELDGITVDIKSKLESAHNFVIIKDVKENKRQIKALIEVNAMENIQLCEKVDIKRGKFFKSSKIISKPWTEIEDTILRHPEYTEVNNHLLKTRGKDEVTRRKLFLGTP